MIIRDQLFQTNRKQVPCVRPSPRKKAHKKNALAFTKAFSLIPSSSTKFSNSLNTDLLLTQSRQQLALGQLPLEVSQLGIDVKKSLTAPMTLIALYSPNESHDAKFVSKYAYINLKRLR